MNEFLEPFLGKFYQKLHIYPLRVFYEDTDAGGIVYYANYLKFAERARSELLRTLGFNNSKIYLDGEAVAFAVKNCSAEYLSPAKLDDALNVITKVVTVGGASINMEQRIVRKNAELVLIKIKLACIRLKDGKPSRLPSDIKNALSELI